MDFRQSAQSNNRPVPNPAPAVPAAPQPINNNHLHRPSSKASLWLRILNITLLFIVAILVLAVAFYFTRSSTDNESKYINTSKYQAVFLTNGQVYFGNIGVLNSKYIELDNVYYLMQNSTSTTTTTSPSYTLLQLGCQQIHDPYDQMIINRDQVSFWENLQDSGTVVTKIKQAAKQTVDCSNVTTQTQASSTSTQGAASTTPTTTTTTTK